METKATWKRVGKAALAIVLVIALSAGTALFIHRRSGVPTAAAVKNGLSAYELAVAEGYSGTMQEWLASLRGQSAYALAQEAGYTGSESDWAARLAKLAQSDPVSLTAANFNNRGQLILTLSDGTTLNLGNAVGENGKNGSDGRNGTDGKNGADGKDGKDGKDGLNGVSVSGVDLTDAGELVLRFSDDRMVNVGRVTGAQGIQGEKGEKGDTGAQGAQGEKGEKGDTGAQGAQGEKGEKGDTGAQGVQGEKGEKGDTGAQGIQGEKGEKGDTGAQGVQGEKGEKGDTGAQGVQGEKGEKGDTGAQGAQGEKGEKGDTGAAGNGIQTIRLVDGTMTVELTDGSKFTFENVRGENGADGVSPQVRINAATNQWEISADEGENWVSTGVQATGARGEAGASGEKGEKGDKGDPGQNGVSPRVMIDPASREWKISTDNGLTWTGTGISATGEKGEKGDTGAQGAQGEKGEKGDTGARGVQGEKGEKGDTGAQGAQGEKGEKGDTGAQGIQGEKGEKGDTGAQGIQGEKGEKGDTGAQGAQGEKGEKGDTGAQGAQGEKGEKGDPGAQGAQGEKGEKGDTGVSVTGVTLEDYKLVVTLSDGTVLRLEQSLLGATGAKGDTGAQGVQGEKGEKGDTGAAGRGIERVVLTAEGCLIFEYTDGTRSEPTASLVGAQGAQGEKGDKGDTGADGRGIVTVSLDGGDLYVTYSDSATPVRIGTVRGEKGDKGDPGAQGEKGDPGVDGKSAYELYKAAYPDYTGTLTEWLASLKGDTGRGIQKTEIVDGKLIVTYTDGTQEDLGSITAGDPSASPDDYFVFTLLEDGTYGVGISETHKRYAKEAIIPSVHNGKAVTAILNSGFSRCQNLEEITIPETVKILERYAFEDCAMLKSVVLPDSVESIGSCAFQGCTSLSFVQLPINPNFTKLGEQIVGTSSAGNVRMSYVFSGCSSLKKIRIPKSVMDIAFDCFEKTGLEELELEETAGWKSYRYFDSTYGTSIAFGNDAKENARIFMTKVKNVNWEGTLMKRTVE